MEPTHPGVPEYDETTQRVTDRPAAQAKRQTENRPAILGAIVERMPEADSFLPPGASRPSKTKTTDSYDQLRREISLDNEKKLASMTDEEILQAQEELRQKLPPKLLERLSKSGR